MVIPLKYVEIISNYYHFVTFSAQEKQDLPTKPRILSQDLQL